jgi:hypothetical protein
MRTIAAVLTVPLLLVPVTGSAQSRFALSARTATFDPRSERRPVVAVAPVTIADGDSADSLIAIQRTSDRLMERLRPLERRFQSDDRLRRAGTVVGIGAIAVGALRGTAPLTFAGTQALRFGLRSELTAIERRSGFVVEPSIGHRSVAVTVSRTFKN